LFTITVYVLAHNKGRNRKTRNEDLELTKTKKSEKPLFLGIHQHHPHKKRKVRQVLAGTMHSGWKIGLATESSAKSGSKREGGQLVEFLPSPILTCFDIGNLE
jgi:hypothetical protein